MFYRRPLIVNRSYMYIISSQSYLQVQQEVYCIIHLNRFIRSKNDEGCADIWGRRPAGSLPG
jgi:hypothetical protein